jgi:hypothetical protein
MKGAFEMGKREYSLYTALFVALLTVALCSTAWSAELTGEQIVRNAKEKETPKSGKTRTKMLLVNSKGDTRIREIVSMSKKTGDTNKNIIRFLAPADVKGTAFLHIEEGGKNQQFIYLPEIKRVRRIATGQRRTSFMGSDFTYQDMEKREIEDDNYKLLREEPLNGESCWVIEAISKKPEDAQYGKVISWIRKDHTLLKAEFYDLEAKLLKVLTVNDLKTIDGFLTATKSTMEDVQKNHKTIVELFDVKYNVAIPDDEFTERALQK